VISPARALTLLIPTAVALYAGFNGVQAILAPDRIAAIDPSGKIADLAWLTTICAGTGVAGLMGVGAASDATRGRFGRRAPWLAAMALLALGAAWALSGRESVAGVALWYGALWFCLNGFQAALLAVAPDRVPERLKNRASSLFAVAGPLGGLVGINLAAWLPPEIAYVALFGGLGAATLIFLVFAREAPYPAAEPATRGARPALGALSSFASHDYALAFLFRLLMFTAQFSINNYLLYILRDYIGEAALPGHDARAATGIVGTVRVVVTLAAILAAHFVVERTSRRRVFAQAYAALMALSMLAPMLWPSWPGMLLFAGFGGAAMGVYAVIDLTLMSRVLPTPASAGRDLAMLVMAGATAQFLAPPLASLLIDRLGYPALFLAAAWITIVAGAVVGRIKGVE
jgi:MFS family permease